MLDNKSKRTLSLFNILSSSNRWYKSKELADNFWINERSILRYCMELEQDIKKFKKTTNSGLNIIFEKNTGMKLVVDDSNDLLKFTEYILKNNDKISFLISNLLCEKTDIDLSHRYIGDIKEFLSKFDLNFSKKDGIIGDEHIIRIVTYGLITYIFKTQIYPEVFNKLSRHKLENNVNYLSDILNLDISTNQKRDLMILFSINIIRFRGKKMIPAGSTIKDIAILSKNQEWTLYTFTEKLYSDFHIYNADENTFLALNIAIRPFIYDSKRLINTIIDTHKHKDSEIYKSTMLFMDFFSDIFLNLPYSKYNKVFIYIFRSHLYGTIYKKMDYDYNGYIYLRKEDDNLEKSSVIIDKLIDDLKKESEYQIFNEKQYLRQVYYVALTYVKPDLFHTELKLDLKSSLSEIQQHIIKDIIIDRFKYDFNISFVDDSLENIDMTLTTDVFDDNYFFINVPTTQFEFSSLNKELNRIMSQKKKNT